MKQKASKLISLESDLDNRDAEIPIKPMEPLEVASFIEGMTAELRIMARNAELSTLSYFLEMARIEASAEVERLASPSRDRR